MKCNVTRQTATWLQQADHVSIRSYFGLQQADDMPNYSDLISGYSRPILGRSYAELFRSYFGLQQADLISALGETRA